MIYTVKVKIHSNLIPALIGGATGIGSGLLAHKLSKNNKVGNAITYGISGGLTGFGLGKYWNDNRLDRNAHNFYRDKISPLEDERNSHESLLDKDRRYGGFLSRESRRDTIQKVKDLNSQINKNQSIYDKMPRSSENSFKISAGSTFAGLALPLFTASVKTQSNYQVRSEIPYLLEDPEEYYDGLTDSDKQYLESLDEKLDPMNWNQARELYLKNNSKVLKIISKTNYALTDELLGTWFYLGSLSHYYSGKFNFPIFSSLNYLRHIDNVSPSAITKMKKIDSDLVKCKSEDDRKAVLNYYATDIDNIRDYTRRDYIDDYIKAELE